MNIIITGIGKIKQRNAAIDALIFFFIVPSFRWLLFVIYLKLRWYLDSCVPC